MWPGTADAMSLQFLTFPTVDILMLLSAPTLLGLSFAQTGHLGKVHFLHWFQKKPTSSIS